MGQDAPFGSDETSGDDMVGEIGESEERMADTGTAFGPQEGGGGGVAPGLEDQFDAPSDGEELPTRGILADTGPADSDPDEPAA